MKIHNDWKPFLAAAKAQGWEIKPCKRGHNACVLYPVDRTKSPVSIPSTPGSRNRGLENKRSELRRAGLEI